MREVSNNQLHDFFRQPYFFYFMQIVLLEFESWPVPRENGPIVKTQSLYTMLTTHIRNQIVHTAINISEIDLLSV